MILLQYRRKIKWEKYGLVQIYIFGHVKDFLWKPRGFSNIEEHDATIIKNFNSIVNDDDDLYILGDLMLNDNENGLEKLSKLKGKIHIIFGNHDSQNKIDLYQSLENIKGGCYATVLKYKKAHFYLSHYPTITANPLGQNAWYKNLVNLYGHTHQKDKFYNNNPYMYHVGVDSHNCFPVEIEEIIEDIRNKKCELNIPILTK